MLLANVAIASTLGAGLKVYRDKRREREKPWAVAAKRMAKNQPLTSRKRRASLLITVSQGAKKIIKPFKTLSASDSWSNTRQEQLKEISATGEIEVSEAEKKNNRYFAIALS